MTAPSFDAWNIVLTGFMGTGKSTVGRLLADRLGFEFVDTDTVIEDRHGPIASIFADEGEDAFRSIERGVAQELADRQRLVIATGGRMMLDEANIAALSRNGRVFCLLATPEAILERVTADPSGIERPLLAVADPQQRIVELLTERSYDYARFAQLTTDGRSPEAIADDLAALATSEPQRLTVDWDAGTYEFIVGVALLPLVRQLADIDGPLVIVTDTNTGELYLPSCPQPDLVVTIPSERDRHEHATSVELVLDALREANIDAGATIMSLGDRTIGDLAATAAAAYMGTVDLIHCATDLLAMIDTGGDPGPGQQHPRAVIADVATLQTLPAPDLAAELAQLVGGRLVADPALVEWVERQASSGADAAPVSPSALGHLQSLVVSAVLASVESVQEHNEDESGVR